MKYYERVKLKFSKLTIGPYDLVLVEGTPRMLMLQLYYLSMYEQLFFFGKNGFRL